MSRRFVAALLLLCAATAVSGQPAPEVIERVTNEDDVSELVRRYVESRVDKPLFWKPCLKIGGDVRFEYNHYADHGSVFVPNADAGADFRKRDPNVFIVSGNVYLQFDLRHTWAKLQIEAVNPGGTWPEKPDSIRLKSAVVGHDFYCCGCNRIFAELGRQRLDEHFDSEVQFGSRLDGGFARASVKVPGVGETYAQGALMVVNAPISQYAYVAEVGTCDICRLNLYAKLSFVDWTNGGLFTRDRALFDQLAALPPDATPQTVQNTTSAIAKVQPDLGYSVLQLLVGKDFPNAWRGRCVKVYGAGLYNLRETARIFFVNIPLFDANGNRRVNAQNQPLSQLLRMGPFRHDRLAWYVGVQLGEVCACGDWALKVVYQYVEPFAILPSDNNGIGRTNESNVQYFGDQGILLAVTNYKGVHVEANYAVLDSLTVRLQFQHADHIRSDLFGSAHFNRIMVRTTYAF
jgi:hypothetical protein